MKRLYIDCTSGISGDMVLKALLELGADISEAEKLKLPEDHHHDRHHEQEGHHHHSHRSHSQIKALIRESDMSPAAKETALSIYSVIARAEAKVHETDEESVHFHEVGRNEAIRNITGIAAALENMDVKEIFCSRIHDGKGFITCSHGKIPVPVPAVMAMREYCSYPFEVDDVETEMVTPSGLGVLMGIGAEYADKMPPGTIIKTVTIKGGRDTGKEGLKVSLIEGE